MIHSTNARSFVKAACYRVVTTSITTGAVYLMTYRVTFTLAMLLLDGLVMTIIYYLHERLWQRIKWGRIEAAR